MVTTETTGMERTPVSSSDMWDREPEITVKRRFRGYGSINEVIVIEINGMDVFRLVKFEDGDVHAELKVAYEKTFHKKVKLNIETGKFMSKAEFMKMLHPQWRATDDIDSQDFKIVRD